MGTSLGATMLLTDRWSVGTRIYLPQVNVKAHSTILSHTSRTTLTQTFVNSDALKGIKELKYSFPLFDSVSVVGFKCRVGDRVIEGEVQEKQEAKETLDKAVAQGQVAGLLEQLPNASDVFMTTVSNISPNAKIHVDITYLGELKHGAEVNGVRFTIPTYIYINRQVFAYDTAIHVIPITCEGLAS